MPAADRREILADLGAKLLHLYVLRAEACSQEDWHRVRTLEAEIEQATGERNGIIFSRASKVA
jgi:hypothetical protein